MTHKGWCVVKNQPNKQTNIVLANICSKTGFVNLVSHEWNKSVI